MAKVSEHQEIIEEFESLFEDLRRRYDMFFQGSEGQKTPPTTLHGQFGGKIRRIREEAVKWSAMDRFRIQQLHQRFISFERMWARTQKQIEDGTHWREKQKLRKKLHSISSSTSAETSLANQKPFIAQPIVAASSTASTVVPQNSTDNPNSAAVSMTPQVALMSPNSQNATALPYTSSITEQKVQKIHQVLMEANRRAGVSSSMTVQTLQQQLESQIPRLKEKYACDEVDFRVVLKDGKPLLKAIPQHTKKD